MSQPKTIRELQAEIEPWSLRNFPTADATQQLLGIQEEVGELSHAHLKEMQGIRQNEDHVEMAKDALGDIFVFLAGYAIRRGFALQDIVEQV